MIRANTCGASSFVFFRFAGSSAAADLRKHPPPSSSSKQAHFGFAKQAFSQAVTVKGPSMCSMSQGQLVAWHGSRSVSISMVQLPPARGGGPSGAEPSALAPSSLPSAWWTATASRWAGATSVRMTDAYLIQPYVVVRLPLASLACKTRPEMSHAAAVSMQHTIARATTRPLLLAA